ncbi:MAG: serine/threonine protein kinase [Rubripirellula sp.]
MPRSRLGPLAIESKLGDHPSQSSVWRAIHVQLKRAVAVKVFAAPFGGTPEARAEFSKEWESLKQLQHPAIVRCYGGGFEETEAYLAHELIEGPTLASELEHRTRMSWESVLDLAEPLSDALNYLHGREIVYGALRPDKILFAGLSPVLVDVRIDRVHSVYRSNRPLTLEEVALAPPEILVDANAATPRGDLYSLGAVLYWALTGRPPIGGEDMKQVAANVATEVPESPASIVMDCPVWLDKLVMQLLEKDPEARPHGAAAVTLALAEVRRRAMSRAGVAEHASAGFSPLNVTDQKERDEARVLLGHGALDFDDETVEEPTAWHDRPLVLIAGLLMVTALFAYFIWPLNEAQMRDKAEALLTENTRNALNQAKTSYLIPMVEKYPEGEHLSWAQDQIDRVNMVQAEHALSVKLKRNFPLKNEGERLYAEANEFERFGDTATALDRYRSMETLLGDDAEYRPFVNLARRQIAEIEREGVDEGEAARIIQAKLDEAERLNDTGKVVAAKKIWYSVVELYGNNGNVAPLVGKAQERLTKNASEGNKENP